MGLVEREKEIAKLRELYRACLRGKSELALISGVAGSGKTALLQTFSEWAIDSGATVLSATAFRAEDALPLGILGQLFGNPDLDSSFVDPVRQLLDDCVLIPVLTEHQLESAAQATARAFEGLRRLLVDLAEHTPVVIGVDDVENADAPSLQCLQYFARRTRTSRLLIVLSECTPAWSTNSRLHADLLRQPNCHHVRLAPLSQSGVATLLAERIGAASAQRLAHTGYTASGGNLLLVQGLIDDWRMSADTSPTRVPFGNAFRSAMLSCLSRCEPTALSVARALAVMGHATSPACLSEFLGARSEILGFSARWPAQSAASLDAAGLLDAGWFRPEAPAAAVLLGMAPEERAALHSHAADVLHGHDVPVAIIATHLIAADHVEPSWAVPMLQDAAEQALAHNQVGVAIRCLQRAHVACTSERQRAVIESALTKAEGGAAQATAARHLPVLIEAVHEGRLAGRAATALISYLLWLGQTSEAADVLAALHHAAKDRA